MPLTFPNQVLMRPSQHLDCLPQITVTGNLAMILTVGTHHIGKQFRIGTIRFRT
jgi:DNA-binding sugar fermentation-stimulating protein